MAPSPTSRTVSAPASMGIHAVSLPNGIHLIVGNVRQFHGFHFKLWAREFALVTQPWQKDILDVVQGAGRPETTA